MRSDPMTPDKLMRDEEQKTGRDVDGTENDMGKRKPPQKGVSR